MKDAKARLRRKKVYSFLDVGRVPVTNEHGNVVNNEVAPEPKTLAGYIARELSVQQAKTAAEQKARQDIARAEHDARVKAYWGQQPASALMNSPVGMRDDYSGLEIGQSVPNAGLDFLAELEKEGVTLTLAAKQRSGKYIESQNKHLGAAVTVANLRRAYERLKSLGVFADGEVTDSRPVEPVEAKTGPTLGELYAKADSSPQADRELRKVVDYLWAQEHAPLVEEFYSFVTSTYGVPLTDDDATYLFGPTGLFVQKGWPINAEKLNAARRHMSNIGRWVDAQGNPAISVEEYFSAKLSRGEMDYPEYMRECQKFSRLNLWASPLREAKTKGLL
jgi:hypothetical protein